MQDRCGSNIPLCALSKILNCCKPKILPVESCKLQTKLLQALICFVWLKELQQWAVRVIFSYISYISTAARRSRPSCLYVETQAGKRQLVQHSTFKPPPHLNALWASAAKAHFTSSLKRIYIHLEGSNGLVNLTRVKWDDVYRCIRGWVSDAASPTAEEKPAGEI